MSYPQQPAAPKHSASSYSSGSSDPFNPSVQQLPYGEQHNPYTSNGGPNPGAGGAGVAPPLAGGQYAPMYDTDAEMQRRYEGGGRGAETYMSESGASMHGELILVFGADNQMATSMADRQTTNTKVDTTLLELPLPPLLREARMVIVPESLM